MSSFFEQARQDLKQAATRASEPVSIQTRDGRLLENIPARVGMKVFKTYSGDATFYAYARRFIIFSADLDGYSPANGDLVKWRGRAYRMGNPDGGPPWRWHGNAQDCLAIIATEVTQK